MTITHVSGERVEDLLLAFEQIEFMPGSDGRVHAEVEFEPEVALPLRRALMRTEADLLVAAADRLEDQPYEPTLEQRAADAFIELGRRVVTALRQ